MESFELESLSESCFRSDKEENFNLKELARKLGSDFKEDTICYEYNNEDISFIKEPEKERPAELIAYQFDSDKYSFLPSLSEYKAFMYNRSSLFASLNKEGASLLPSGLILEYTDSYVQLLIAVERLLSATQSEMEREDIKRFMGSFFLIDSIKLSNLKMVYVSCFHPLFLLQVLRQEHCRDYIKVLENCKAKFTSFADSLWRSLISVIWIRDIPKRLFGESVIYTLDRECNYLQDGMFTVKQMRTLSTLTSIDSIRIIEKVKRRWIHFKQGKGADKEADKKIEKKASSELKIAYFGEFNEMLSSADSNCDLNIQKYLNLEIIRKHLGMEKNDKITFHHFKKEKDDKNDFYICGSEGYNLLDTNHMDALFSKYNMVLFLDLGSNYRKAAQQNRQSFSNAYSLYEFVKDMEKDNESKKLALYQTILTYWTKWGFAWFGDKSGEYEFNRDIYNSIRLRSSRDCDVYVYISNGKKIEEIDLEASNLCKGEYYYGDNLIVSHFMGDEEMSVFPLLQCDRENKEPEYCLYISGWRIFKSLYDKSFELLAKSWKDAGYIRQETEDVMVVCLLQTLYIKWDYRFLTTTEEEEVSEEGNIIKLEIGYLDKAELNDMFVGEQREQALNGLKDDIAWVFTQAFCKERNEIRNYMRNVIMEALKSSCRFLEDYLFLYYIDNDFTVSAVVGNKIGTWNMQEEDFKMVTSLTRQALHTLLTEVSRLHIRDEEEDGPYFREDMRKKYCSGIEENDFLELLRMIRKYMERGFDYEDRLFYNISVLCQD